VPEGVIDFTAEWSERTELLADRFISWLGVHRGKFYAWTEPYGTPDEHNGWILEDHWLTSDEEQAILDFHQRYPLDGYRRLTCMTIDQDLIAASPTTAHRVLRPAGCLDRWTRRPSKIRDGLRAAAALPPRIISDNGHQFVAADFKTPIRLTDMTHVRTAPYYPQSNSKLERFHQTIKGDAIRPKAPPPPTRPDAWSLPSSTTTTPSGSPPPPTPSPLQTASPIATPPSPRSDIAGAQWRQAPRGRPVPSSVTRPPRQPTVSSLRHQPESPIHARSVQMNTEDRPARCRVAVIIATSCCRTQMLLDRALTSVYGQLGVAAEDIGVVIVDDNTDSTEFERIGPAIVEVRNALGLAQRAFATRCTRNTRTLGHSGTGAWNTALDFLAAQAEPPPWVAFLDDDDEFLPDHLARCLAAADCRSAAVFEQLEWIRADGVEPRPFTVDDLTPEAFFVGNPGVQGSNLFVRLNALMAIGGFDESLPSATDRDLMIRLLRHASTSGQTVKALPSVGVRYFDHDGPRVNTDLAGKHRALCLLYAKHAPDFSAEQLAASLERAHRLFGYEAARD
jgi:transposase InsO family protein